MELLAPNTARHLLAGAYAQQERVGREFRWTRRFVPHCLGPARSFSVQWIVPGWYWSAVHFDCAARSPPARG